MKTSTNNPNGQIIHINSFPSNLVNPRDIRIWLPYSYTESKKYAVLYMHDGQMLFDSTITWTGNEWKVDETLTRLMNEGKIKDAIVVGIDNDGGHRAGEYFPQAILPDIPEPLRTEMVTNFLEGDPAADKYLSFIVTELKPYIDSIYSTLPDLHNTLIMGSSMGGLISLYAVCEYPDVFGGAACMSTHWPIRIPYEESGFDLPALYNQYLDVKLPSPATHKIYFDYGTATLDSLYPPLQQLVDSIMVKHGYTSESWVTREFPGDEHSEVAWSRRFHIPVEFLLGK